MCALIPSLAFFMFLSAAFRGSRTPVHGACGDAKKLKAWSETRSHALQTRASVAPPSPSRA
jgi:hypothetical protein